MRGDRYGYVVAHGAHTVRVKLDSGRQHRYFMEDLATVDKPSASDWKNDA